MDVSLNSLLISLTKSGVTEKLSFKEAQQGEKTIVPVYVSVLLSFPAQFFNCP